MCFMTPNLRKKIVARILKIRSKQIRLLENNQYGFTPLSLAEEEKIETLERKLANEFSFEEVNSFAKTLKLEPRFL